MGAVYTQLSLKERRKIEDGRLSVAAAARVLDLTRRQVHRLLRRFREDGQSGICHRARGRAPNNRIGQMRRTKALELVRESYADFGPTLAAEMLADHHGLKVSRETLRKWMTEDGLWLSRRHRKVCHQSRLRRECQGELIRSTVRIIAGSRTVPRPARFSSSSTMRQAA